MTHSEVPQNAKGDPDAEYDRLTILISRDAIEKLDKMTHVAGYTGRGRTLQALIDTVWDAQVDIRLILDITNELKNNPIHVKEPLPMLVRLLLVMEDTVARMNRFLGITSGLSGDKNTGVGKQ